MKCYLFEAPSYLFFAPDLPELLYYSHIPTAIIAILVGLFVIFHRPRQLLNQLLFLISICFSLWTLASLIAWTNVNGDLIAFIWPFFGVLSAFISILSIYFIYVFVYGEEVRFRTKLIFFLLLAPVLLFAHTNLSISGFDIAVCDAFAFEGFGYKLYYTALGFLAMGWIAILLYKQYRVAQPEFRKQIVLMGVGIEFFLFSFITTTFLVTYLTTLGYFEDSRLEMYGLFGMLVFMIFVSILIVRFKAFNVGLAATNALVAALLVLTASQFTFVTTKTSLILSVITFVLTSVIGYILIKSVKREIEQREQIEKLAKNLERANKRLRQLDKLKSEFVSIASHQLRSPLTSIRGFASMLLEGSFGKIPAKASEAVQHIADSSQFMATSVEDYLNVSRIESGNMKYELSDFNLRDETERVVDELRPEATKRGIALMLRTDLSSQAIVNADRGKVRQILHNLIQNALKYTPKGSIDVVIHDDTKAKRITVSVVDTGIGMSEKTIERLFGKFERADNAHKVNVTGTGLGLFIARTMARSMNGDITATSKGEGQGSNFSLDLPLEF